MEELLDQDAVFFALCERAGATDPSSRASLFRFTAPIVSALREVTDRAVEPVFLQMLLLDVALPVCMGERERRLAAKSVLHHVAFSAPLALVEDPSGSDLPEDLARWLDDLPALVCRDVRALRHEWAAQQIRRLGAWVSNPEEACLRDRLVWAPHVTNRNEVDGGTHVAASNQTSLGPALSSLLFMWGSEDLRPVDLPGCVVSEVSGGWKGSPDRFLSLDGASAQVWLWFMDGSKGDLCRWRPSGNDRYSFPLLLLEGMVSVSPRPLAVERAVEIFLAGYDPQVFLVPGPDGQTGFDRLSVLHGQLFGFSGCPRLGALYAEVMSVRVRETVASSVSGQSGDRPCDAIVSAVSAGGCDPGPSVRAVPAHVRARPCGVPDPDGRGSVDPGSGKGDVP